MFVGGEAVRVAYRGGAFRNTALLDRFRALVEMDPDCKCGPPMHKPAMGALIEAWRAAGVGV